MQLNDAITHEEAAVTNMAMVELTDMIHANILSAAKPGEDPEHLRAMAVSAMLMSVADVSGGCIQRKSVPPNLPLKLVAMAMIIERLTSGAELPAPKIEVAQ